MKYFQLAGERAATRSAMTEAARHYARALELLSALPENDERDAREFELGLKVAAMLQVTRGWAAAETVEVVERVAALAEKSGNLTQLGNSLASRGLTALITGDLSTAGVLADQALQLALRDGDPAILASRHLLQLMVLYQLGELDRAQKCLTTGLEFSTIPPSAMVLLAKWQQPSLTQACSLGCWAEPILPANACPR